MKPMNPRNALARFIGAAVLVLPASLHAASITLDWNAVSWISGALAQSFDIDPANPGNDVTDTVIDSAGRIAQAVSTTTLITGGVSATNKTLQLVPNFLTNQESISVRIDFLYPAGVRDVSYFIHDIDGNLSAWQEEVRGISATGNTLPNFPPTSLLRTGATPTFQITGTGLAQLLTATSEASDDSNNGTASVSFGTALVRTTGFTSGAATAGNFDPIESGIALGNLTYNNVPEPSSALLLLSALALAGFRRR